MELSLRASVLTNAGFRHGFSVRQGGVSAAPFDSLNLARNLGDAADAVAENHRRFAKEVGYAPDWLFEASQVHGHTLIEADGGPAPMSFRARQADAILASVPGQAAAVRVADCVPILVADSRTGAVVAIHAGWRGVVAQIVPLSIARLLERTGSAAPDLRAAIGPHIGPAAFEIGFDVAEQLREAVRIPGVILEPQAGSGARPHADLGRAVRAQLESCRLPDACVEIVGGCTYTDTQRFFSYRRDGERAGRHLAVIVAGC